MAKTKKNKNVVEEQLPESANIVNYIKSISEKNYAKANKYLHAAIEDKMRDKIKNTADKMEF
jgi:hypothetical protein|tara:strand:- start:10073 stop:10258 length:186 start_codon:yes stop_codon:yes gene_type:complete